MQKIRIIGNEDCLSLIDRWQRKNQFPQSILINGADGSGRTTLAKYIAQAALCSNEHKPCGQCSHCRKVFDGTHPDITIVSKESDGFKLDNIRNLRTSAIMRPNEAARRVIIIKNAHDMSVGSQNALLKIIEEPPSFVMFIFTCSEDKRLLDTIISRCITISTSPVSADDAAPYLKERVRELSDFAASQAIQQSVGNIGKALHLLTEKPTKAQELSEQMGRAIMLKDELLLMRVCGRMEKDKALYEQTLSMLLTICRDALIIKSGSDKTLSGMLNLTQDMSNKVSSMRLCNCIETIEKLISYSQRYMNNTLLISLTSSELLKV